MEVHPPDHTIHGWRDVLIHLGIVTLGLLIALSLEALVEMAHRHHLANETRANLQEERHVNEKYLDVNIRSYRKLRAAMESNVRILKTLKQHPGKLGEVGEAKLYWKAGWQPLSEAEWHTANQTTGLSLMPPHEVAEYAETYTEADQVNVAWDKAGHHIFELGGYEHIDPARDHLSAPQIDELLHGAGVVLAQLQVVGLELKNWSETAHVERSDFTKEEIIRMP